MVSNRRQHGHLCNWSAAFGFKISFSVKAPFFRSCHRYLLSYLGQIHNFGMYGTGDWLSVQSKYKYIPGIRALVWDHALACRTVSTYLGIKCIRRIAGGRRSRRFVSLTWMLGRCSCPFDRLLQFKGLPGTLSSILSVQAIV